MESSFCACFAHAINEFLMRIKQCSVKKRNQTDCEWINRQLFLFSSSYFFLCLITNFRFVLIAGFWLHSPSGWHSSHINKICNQLFFGFDMVSAIPQITEKCPLLFRFEMMIRKFGKSSGKKMHRRAFNYNLELIGVCWWSWSSTDYNRSYD